MVRKSYGEKKRRSGWRKPKRLLLISSEGNQRNKTERQYFQHFTSDRLTVRFVSGNETDPASLMKQLIRSYKESELTSDDLAVCLTDGDFDERRNEQLNAAEQLAKNFGRDNLRLIVSSPCFEIWLLCHFQYSTHQYGNAGEVLCALSACLAKEYTKSMDVYVYVHGKEEIAIANAKRLEAYQLAQGRKKHSAAFSPSTEVYAIFEECIMK